MNHPLDGAMFKLRRADERSDELERAIDTFLGNYSYGFRVEPDRDSGEVCIWPKVFRDPPVIEWGGLIGEIVHPLRSSLDHLIWALTIDHSRTPPIPLTPNWRHVAFPVFASEHDGDHCYAPLRRDGTPRDGGGARNMLWGVHPSVEAIIKRLQPFSCGDEFASLHPLSLLDELWNIDKHRHPTTCISTVGVKDVRLDSPYRYEVVSIRNPGPFKEEAEEPLFRFRYLDAPPLPDNPEVDVHLDLHFDVAFDEEEPIGKSLVGETLTGIRTFVVNVLNYFGPFLDPGGG
jgi:hypothetical protein